MSPRFIAAVVLLTLGSGCQCGRNILVDTLEPGQLSDAGTGVLRFCGDAIVNAPEECDLGLEGSATSTCNSDCTFNRSCPVGESWSERDRACHTVGFDAGAAEVVGLLNEYTGILPPTSALHPYLPIKDAVVRLQLKGSSTDVGVAITRADGTFRFAVNANVAYQIRYEVPDLFEAESPTYARELLPIAPGGIGRADSNFLRRGLHFAVRERSVDAVISGAKVKIVDDSMNVLAAERLTDAEGYVFFERTSRPGKMVFEKVGFQPETLGGASVNTTHTVVGGMSLQRE